jgi:site-specific DNA recombinase
VQTLETLREEESKVQAEMQRTYRLYQADEISVEGFGRLYRPLEQRLKQIEDELPRLQGEVDFLRINTLSRDEVLSGTKDLTASWPNLTLQERRQIVEAMVERIEVGRDEVVVSLLGIPSPFELATERQRNFKDSSPPPTGSAPET